MNLVDLATKEDRDSSIMQEKTKRRRSPETAEKTAAVPKARKSRAKKPQLVATPPVVPVTGGPVPATERLDATVPLSPLRLNGTNTITQGGITTLGAMNTAPVPRRLVCQQVEASYLSDVGQVRSNNEDSASAFLATVPRPGGGQEMLFGFLAVADGMGGHDKGEVASNIAVRKMTEGVLHDFYLPTVEGRPPGRGDSSPVEVLRSLIEDANQAILQESHLSRTSMGTTLTCAVLVGQTAFIGHVGDSRMYILEKSTGQLQLITRDHSMVQRLVDLGQLSVEDAANSPQRSVLYMSLGQKGRIEADVDIVSLTDASYLLLCSDGLWDMLNDDQIEQILKEAIGPAEASASLVAAANEAGGNDNVTVVIAKL